MARRRIAVLLIGAFVVGLGIVAYFQATPSWSYAAFVFVPVTCALAAVMGILRGRQAPFSIGFAVCSAVLMTTVFPLRDHSCFSELIDRMTDDAYAETLPEPEQELYYERVLNQGPIVGAALIVAAASIVGLAALFAVPPAVDRLARRFSVQRLMIAVVVVAVGLAFGREQYRNYQGEVYRSNERRRVLDSVAKAVRYGEILQAGGIAMSGYHPGNGLPPDYSHFDEYPEIWAAGGEINERIATVLVHGDVRMLVVRGTKISDEARAILSSGFDLGDGTGQPCLFVGDKPQDDCCVLPQEHGRCQLAASHGRDLRTDRTIRSLRRIFGPERPNSGALTSLPNSSLGDRR